MTRCAPTALFSLGRSASFSSCAGTHPNAPESVGIEKRDVLFRRRDPLIGDKDRARDEADALSEALIDSCS